MSEATKDDITMTYDGSSSGNVIVSATVNEGIDKSASFTVIAGDKSEAVTVVQAGRREIFNCTDGEFLLSDSGTYNVIKDGLQ